MKICILTPRFPFPENGGDVLRINNIARYLKSKGHSLILVSFHTAGNDIEEARKLYDKIYTVEHRKTDTIFYSFVSLLKRKPIQCGYYYSRRFKKVFEEAANAERPDRYIAHLLRMAPYLEEAALQDSSIVEMTDALSKTYSLSSTAKGGFVKKAIYKIEKNLIRNYERHVIGHFPKVVLVSQSDIDFLRSQMPGPSLELHTNGVGMAEGSAPQYNANKICFIGNMRTLQNQDAVLHFIKDIFPIILQKKPDAEFHIVGAEPPHNIKKLACRNIIVTGFVENLEAAVNDSCLAVAPVQIAAGIQNKVLVAMANGLPVIMTSLISKAIPELTDADNCYIKDNPEEFAQRCIELMSDPAKRNKIAENGKEIVRRYYSWNEKLNGYEDLPEPPASRLP